MLSPGDTFEGVLKDLRFTSGSPFGEQWSAIQLDDGEVISIATWINYSATTKNSPRVGDRVKVTVGRPKTCHTGFGGKIHCKPCAHDVIKI